MGSAGEENIDIYCDGAWDSNGNMGGYAAVAVSRGNILKCSAGWNPNAKSAKEMEWRALMEGVKLATSFTEEVIRLLADNAEMIWNAQAGNWNEEAAAHNGVMCEEFFNRRRNWKLQHIMREANVLADFLARKEKRERWSWDAPDCLPLSLSQAVQVWKNVM